jgi:DNA processing protein
MTPLAHALLRLSLVKGVGPARLRKAMKIANAKQAELEQLVDDRGLSEVLTTEQLDELASVRTMAEVLVEKLRGLNVEVISLADAEYPAQLLRTWGEEHAPPLLMTRGNCALLNRPAVGFCGSREASERGLRAAEDCADQLAAAGVVVASGYAAGVDTCAHAAALKAGGTTIVVLPEGINHFRMKSEVEKVWSWERACVVSEFAATAPWSAGNAMQRNRTIVGVSRAMILIEARATGGSIAAGRDALKAKVPLFAAEYEGMPDSATGNRQLIEQGAQPLLRNRQTMRASLDAVLGAVHKPSSTGEPAAPAPTGQMRLLT